MKIDFDVFFNRLTQTINNTRPADPEPVILSSSGDDQDAVIPKQSPRWHKSTKRTVIIILFVLSVICLFLMHSMIVPMLVSILLVFYLTPLVDKLESSTKLSHKWSVVIVFLLFLIIALGVIAASGFSVYGQLKNFFELIDTSMESLPEQIIQLLGGENSFLGQYFSRLFGLEINTQISSNLERVFSYLGTSALSIVQSLSSKLGWFFFVFGFSFFVLWESDKKDKMKTEKKPIIPGYEYDIEMGRYNLSLIWNRFLWGQGVLFVITTVVYFLFFILFGVRYAFIQAVIVALTRLVPYVGSFVAWAILSIVCMFQGTTIFGLQPLPYTILVVGLAFLMDKSMDGFVQPIFLAQTLKVHPAAVLAAALICARTIGFLGIFLAAPIVATLKLLFHYIFSKLRDEDPWEELDVVDKPVSISDTVAKYEAKSAAFFGKINNSISHLFARYSGGKGHGAS